MEKRVLKVLGDLFVVISMVVRGRREEIKRRGRGERVYCGGCECD